jgi:hypothetical protein
MFKTSTLAAPTVAVAATVVGPEYIRLPSPGVHDLIFGLTRSYLNLLILPSSQNDFRPPVRSSVLRKVKNAKTGVRLVNVASLREYLKRQMEDGKDLSQGGPDRAAVLTSAVASSNVEFIRLPKPKDRDPLFGLSRSILNQLVLPSAQNGYQPPVQSHVLRRRGYKNGIRLISVDSLRQFILDGSKGNVPQQSKTNDTSASLERTSWNSNISPPVSSSIATVSSNDFNRLFPLI